jgi:hypothetical protein
VVLAVFCQESTCIHVLMPIGAVDVRSTGLNNRKLYSEDASKRKTMQRG